ncbi:LytTR family DNA-binding domain-containing protein [Aliishimia ponticola]|nr:LytTR family DNA-binding domain-containing protein [Aliishimia ponticola]
MTTPNMKHNVAINSVTRVTYPLWVRVAALVVLAFALAVSGPFGTFGTTGFAVRLLYWGGVVLALAGVAMAVMRGVRWLGVETPSRRDAAVIAGFVLGFVPILYLWTRAVLPQPVYDRPDLFALAIYVASVTALVRLVARLLPRLAVQSAQPVHAPPAAPQAPRLRRHLPDAFPDAILRLSGEGHYVRVVTTDADCTIRMRLSDAVEDMQGFDGVWTHRSHWVLRSAVVRSGYRRGKPVLILKNGDEVPVSSTYAPDLEAAGLLEPRGMATASA